MKAYRYVINLVHVWLYTLLNEIDVVHRLMWIGKELRSEKHIMVYLHDLENHFICVN